MDVFICFIMSVPSLVFHSQNYELRVVTPMMISAFYVSDDSFVVGSSFELLFSIRPRNPTGLLLHVGDSRRNQYGPAMDHYISVYMLRGEVRLDSF